MHAADSQPDAQHSSTSIRDAQQMTLLRLAKGNTAAPVQVKHHAHMQQLAWVAGWHLVSFQLLDPCHCRTSVCSQPGVVSAATAAEGTILALQAAALLNSVLMLYTIWALAACCHCSLPGRGCQRHADSRQGLRQTCYGSTHTCQLSLLATSLLRSSAPWWNGTGGVSVLSAAS